MKICYGDKSKFIKSALIRAVQGIERNENDNALICERDYNSIKLIVRDEMEKIKGLQISQGKQTASKMTESVAE